MRVFKSSELEKAQNVLYRKGLDKGMKMNKYLTKFPTGTTNN